MSKNKNIEMQVFNGTDYDTLYPKTIASQIPDVYSKTEVLTTETLSKYGLTAGKLPNDAFQQIKTLIDNVQASADGKARIQTGSYVGTGTYGANNQTVITCGFKPKLVMVFGDYVDNNRYTGDIGIFWGNSGFLISAGSIFGYNYFTGRNEAGIEFTDTGLSLYSTDSDDRQLNKASETFDWIAVG